MTAFGRFAPASFPPNSSHGMRNLPFHREFKQRNNQTKLVITEVELGCRPATRAIAESCGCVRRDTLRDVVCAGDKFQAPVVW